MARITVLLLLFLSVLHVTTAQTTAPSFRKSAVAHYSLPHAIPYNYSSSPIWPGILAFNYFCRNIISEDVRIAQWRRLYVWLRQVLGCHMLMYSKSIKCSRDV